MVNLDCSISTFPPRTRSANLNHLTVVAWDQRDLDQQLCCRVHIKLTILHGVVKSRRSNITKSSNLSAKRLNFAADEP